MAIRDRWNRMIRKSAGSSTSSSGDDGHPDPTTPAIATGTTKPVRTTGVSKIASWRNNSIANHNMDTNNHNNPAKEHLSPPVSRPTFKHRPLSFFRSNHPRDRLPTEENLRWQDALGTYTMQFGRSTPASRRSSFSDISPCHSRAGSLDYSEGPSPMSSLGPKDEECCH